ncbi:MAG: TonB-dependent receptor [Chitinophagaceae bacterium]
MKKTRCLFIAFLAVCHASFAQENPLPDSAKTLGEVVITAFEQKRDIASGTIVKVIDNNNADRHNKTSLVNGFNSIAGVRMEERSPGSYRINIRGSSLRSPFGVRNVKVYWNDIPMTDPGGNTYFNQFAFNNFSYIEIFKGPAGSLYGAGTGGLLLMHSMSNSWKPGLQLEYAGGNYGLQNLLGSISFGKNDNRNQLSYAHNESDGYRNHTFSKKDNASFVSQLKISDKQQVTASILYSSLLYETPGGLTLAEFTANPRQARPAAGGQPSADQAKATIYQKNFTAGISQQYFFTPAFKNSTTLYGMFAQVQNPTFRNYERRNEPSFGGRTSFVYEKQLQETRFQLVTGGELQQGYFNTQVSKNKNGRPDTLQTNDDVQYNTYGIFAQADINIKESWIITAGASINKSTVNFTRLSSYPTLKQGRSYKSELSPRIALQKKLGNGNAVFASVSKGFSPPSVAELLPSTGVISTFLEAEEGTNYELGGRLLLFRGKLRIEATGFYFKLNNALVTRKDSSNADYYVNAGNTKQKGIELSADYVSFFNNRFIEYVSVRPAYTISNFKYGNFIKGTADFSGKYLPSVPKYIFSVLADLQTSKGAYLNATYYTASRIFLDDANAVAAGAYHLLGGRLGWKVRLKGAIKLNIYAGADNLLDETYSLGNDINAAAGRYYNAAPGRNYYAGVAFELRGKETKKN